MKPEIYLFPGMENNWRADAPVTTKAAWIAVTDAAKAGHYQASLAAHAPAQLCDAPAGVGADLRTI